MSNLKYAIIINPRNIMTSFLCHRNLNDTGVSCDEADKSSPNPHVLLLWDLQQLAYGLDPTG